MMHRLLTVLSSVVLLSCGTRERLASPVDLRSAISTLPPAAVAGMSPEGRMAYLRELPGEFDPEARRIHLFKDSADGGDAESMLFLRLFEDAQGRTIAASHAARPFAGRSMPVASNTKVHRLEAGRWEDITDEAFAAGIARECFFRFDENGAGVPWGEYVRKARRDGRGTFYDFGPVRGQVRWEHGAFRIKSEDGPADGAER